MKRIRTYILGLLTTISIQSCIPPSGDKIEKIDKPDNNKIVEFGLEINGQIIYEFYQKYGFTDLEEQLILVVKPNTIDYLTNNLPFSSIELERIENIDISKFKKDKSINFTFEKNIQEDIRLESKEYDSGNDKSVFYNQGKYKHTLNDSTETIFVFDSKSGLMYIESKKQFNSR